MHAHTTLNDLITAFVAESEQLAPELKGKLCVYDVASNTYYVSPDFSARKRGFDSIRAFREEYLPGHQDTDGARATAFKDAQYDLHLITLTQELTDAQRANLSAQDVQDIYHTLDHELGHLIIPAAYDDYNESTHHTLLAENIAECFAMIRHHQRFGDDRLPLGSHALELLASYVLNAHKNLSSHFHYPAIRAFEAVSQQIDFTALSLHDSAGLAQRFGRAHAPSPVFVAALRKAFAPVALAYHNAGLRVAIPALADIALTTQEPDIATLAIDISLYELAKPANTLYGHPFDKIRQDLKLRQMQLAADAILYGIPRRAATPDKKPLFTWGKRA